MKKNTFTVPAPMAEAAHRKAERRNLWTYPVGTVGRDMIYQLFTNYILTYTLFTRELTAAQLAAITGIMIAARIFDALNDPIMGNIIFVVAFIFNTRLTGWSYIIAFGICYFLYSITYTMNDISYWGMAPSLGRDADSRNKFTSRATLFAGIGATLATVAIPALTAGSGAIGGNAQTAYGAISLAICIFAPLCLCITIFGVKEDLSYMAEERPKVSFRTIVKTIFGNSIRLQRQPVLCFFHCRHGRDRSPDDRLSRTLQKDRPKASHDSHDDHCGHRICSHPHRRSFLPCCEHGKIRRHHAWIYALEFWLLLLLSRDDDFNFQHGRVQRA